MLWVRQSKPNDFQGDLNTLTTEQRLYKAKLETTVLKEGDEVLFSRLMLNQNIITKQTKIRV